MWIAEVKYFEGQIYKQCVTMQMRFFLSNWRHSDLCSPHCYQRGMFSVTQYSQYKPLKSSGSLCKQNPFRKTTLPSVHLVFACKSKAMNPIETLSLIRIQFLFGFFFFLKKMDLNCSRFSCTCWCCHLIRRDIWTFSSICILVLFGHFFVLFSFVILSCLIGFPSTNATKWQKCWG